MNNVEHAYVHIVTHVEAVRYRGEWSEAPFLWVVWNRKCLVRCVHTICIWYICSWPDHIVQLAGMAPVHVSIRRQWWRQMAAAPDPLGYLPWKHSSICFIERTDGELHNYYSAQGKAHVIMVCTGYADFASTAFATCRMHTLLDVSTHATIVAAHVWVLGIHAYVGPLWSAQCICAVGGDAMCMLAVCNDDARPHKCRQIIETLIWPNLFSTSRFNRSLLLPNYL